MPKFINQQQHHLALHLVTLFSLIVLFPAYTGAHTTTLIPHIDQDGHRSLKVLHFHPASGSGLKGIRLGVEDTKNIKGLNSIFVIHNGQKRQLDDIAIPDSYTVRGENRESYTIPIDKKSGFFNPGDYIVVVQHQPHWKKNEGIYRQKVTKFCLNQFNLVTDWHKRVLRNMPEVIPLVQPYSLYAGSIFRAEVVNDEGNFIPHAKIQIEYLNYPMGDRELNTTTGFISDDIADTFIFTDNHGGFSFIPPREGLWTFTLVDGDNNKFLQGKKLEYDSSLSILVQ